MAIDAELGPMLVLAGPGAGKTFCLIERIRHLIEDRGIDPTRICAFTFTNKAAGEIATRLQRDIGDQAAQVRGGTIHAFCAELLREYGAEVGLQRGFGIADEEYQLAVLRRLFVPERWRRNTLVRFAGSRFRGEVLRANDSDLLDRYERFLGKRNKVDYDTLVIKAAELMTLVPHAADALRAQWDYVLVDEFQDLNRMQYAVVRELARDHRNVFVVGDDDQSIYSWAGADPQVFLDFIKDFPTATTVHLQDNRRCPGEVFLLARRLVTANPSLFPNRVHAVANRESAFPVAAFTFEDIDAEMAWVLADLRRDRAAHALAWGDVALLYRTHEIGDAAESSFLSAGIPCRLAHGRALADDPVVAYVIAAMRVIAEPKDDVHKENFLTVVLPKTLIASARAKAEEQRRRLLVELNAMAHALPREHEDGRKIRRGISTVRNLAALGVRHTAISSLVAELLSQRVGEYRTILEEHFDDLSDPVANPEVRKLAERLSAALDARQSVWLPRQGGVEIGLKGILLGVGFGRVELGGIPSEGAEILGADDTPLLGTALGLFKAAQLVSSREFVNAFRDFTVVDLETTDRDTAKAEIVEIAAVRVRDGAVVAEFQRLVKPRVAIHPAAAATHGIDAAAVDGAPFFEAVWPEFRAFCGRDVLVAHNGYAFDFPIMRRMAKELGLEGGADLCTYDTLPLARELSTGSAKLGDLARQFDVDSGQSHRALDDTRALAGVFLALSERKVQRARTTTLVNLLDHLGVALALSDPDALSPEARVFRAEYTRPYSLGRYSGCLDLYREERALAADDTLPTVSQLIDQLGGEALMLRMRAERTPDQRYPAAMARLRRVLAECASGTLTDQMARFLEKVVLSRWDGTEIDRDRVNLLTLHSTKGLEFSRVYIVGAEDAALIGGTANRPATEADVEEARRLLYVGMTRTKERLVLTRVIARNGKPTGGHQFLDEMGLLASPSPAV